MWNPFKRKKWKDLGRAISADTLHLCITTDAMIDDKIEVGIRDGVNLIRCIPVDDFKTLMFKSRKSDPEYAVDIFDCDDFGDTFMGDMKRGWEKVSRGNEALAFGWAWVVMVGAKRGGSHWINWMVDECGILHFIEPQRNDFIKYGEIIKVLEVTQ